MAKQVPASKLNANDSTQKGRLGQIRIVENAKYRYYKVKDLAGAATKVAEYSTTTDAVTIDRAGGTSIGRAVAGVFYSTVTAGNYGWLQVEGTCSLLVPANVAVSAGQYLIPHATSDGAVTSGVTTATVRQIFAVALGADTATTSAAGVVKAALLRV